MTDRANTSTRSINTDSHWKNVADYQDDGIKRLVESGDFRLWDVEISDEVTKLEGESWSVGQSHNTNDMLLLTYCMQLPNSPLV